MSYILKALKRAQESRRIDGSTVTAAVQRLRVVDRPQRLPWRWIAVGALALNTAAVGLFVVWPHSRTQAPRQDDGPAPAQAAAPMTPAAPTIAAPTAAPTMAAVPPSPPTAATAPTPPPLPTAAPTPTTVRPPAAVTALPAPSPPALVARLKTPEPTRPTMATNRKPERAAADPTERSSGDRTEPVVPRTPAPAAPAPVSTPPPLVEDSPELREVLSKFKIEVLVWAPDPKERMVFLNGRKYVEGQTLDGKVVVELIAEDGVVLAYQGQRVRVKRP